MNFQDIPRNPNDRLLRQFSGLVILFFGGAGLWQLLVPERTTAGWVLIAVAAIVGIPGLIHPRLVKWIFVGWMILVFPIGWLISNVVLAILFFGFFTPIALLMRLRSRDALKLRRREAKTYWETKPGSEDVRSYFRQS